MLLRYCDPPKDCRLYVTTTEKHSRVLRNTFKREKIKQVKIAKVQHYIALHVQYKSIIKTHIQYRERLRWGAEMDDEMVVNVPLDIPWQLCTLVWLVVVLVASTPWRFTIATLLICGGNETAHHIHYTLSPTTQTSYLE